MNMKSALRILPPRMLVIALALMMVPFAVQAECPGSFVPNAGAAQLVDAPGSALDTYIGTGCVGTPVGTNPPAACDSNGTTDPVFLLAGWLTENDRTTASADSGCSFVCEGGTCLVNGSGLPVELLEFSTD